MAFNLTHDLSDAQFLLKNVIGKLFRRKMLSIYFTAWILDIKVAAGLENVGCGDFPGPVVFLSLLPPGDAVGE